MKSDYTVQDCLDTADHAEQHFDREDRYFPPYLEQLCVLAQEVRRLREVCDDNDLDWCDDEGIEEPEDPRLFGIKDRGMVRYVCGAHTAITVLSKILAPGTPEYRFHDGLIFRLNWDGGKIVSMFPNYTFIPRTPGKSYAQRMAATMAKCREDILKAKAPTMVADFGPNGEISQIWFDEAERVMKREPVEPFVMFLHSDPAQAEPTDWNTVFEDRSGTMAQPSQTGHIPMNGDGLRDAIDKIVTGQDGTPGDEDPCDLGCPMKMPERDGTPDGTEDPMEAMRAIVKRYSLPD